MLLNSQEIDQILQAAVAEDLGRGDITTDLLIPASVKAEAHIRTREAIVVCGMPVVQRLISRTNGVLTFKSNMKEGSTVPADTVLATIAGNARKILQYERVLLNLLQRMSGVATLTHHYVSAVKGTKAIILDTRKTMPGLRGIDKYATVIGGARNHRLRLDDGILIKDNHIALSGSIKKAIQLAQKGAPSLTKIEIECDTEAQVKEAVEAGADVILLDNMDIETMTRMVKSYKGKVTLEASGNVSLENVREIAETGVNYISVGAITHSAAAVDIGLDIVLEK